MRRIKTKYYPMGGQLDLTTPAIKLPAGTAIDAKNYEPDLEQGFRRIDGYERFDGRAAPSAAQYWIVTVADNASYTPYDTITGVTSGASAIVVRQGADTDADDATRLVVTAFNGTSFQVGETTAGGGASTITVVEALLDADTPADDEAFTLLAQNYYRSLIAAVPGSGQIRGIWRHLDKTYAFRDNAGATACVLHKSTAAGWAAINLGDTVKFNTGLAAGIAEGDTITGATSGATASVERVIVQSGGWSSNDAVGYLVLSGIAGGPFTAAELIQVSASNRATITANSSAIALNPGGRYEFISHNFFGGTATYRVYGTDGANDAFELDPTTDVYVPIDTTITGEYPTHIEAHLGHLFLSYDSDVVHSQPGAPLNYTGFLGAAQLGLGGRVTGMKSQVGRVLAMSTTRQIYGLYGNDATDWTMQPIAKDAGAKDYTLQLIDDTYGLDDRGVIALRRAQAYGNFEQGTVSRKVQPVLAKIKDLVTASSVLKKRNQYRLYFSDNRILTFYPQATAKGTNYKILPLDYGMPVRVICSCEDETGDERVFFGSDDGYIYEAEKGDSFDGGNIESYVRLAYTHLDSPSIRKRFQRADIELRAKSTVALLVTPDLNYGSYDNDAPTSDNAVNLSLFGGGGFYDVDNFDAIYWDAQTITTAYVDLTGTGTNISFLIYNDSATTASFTLQGITIHYAIGRRHR